MTPRPIVARARETTGFVQQQFATIIKAVRADRWIDGYGVYENRDTVLASLRRIRAAAAEAEQAIAARDWPDGRDYEREVA